MPLPLLDQIQSVEKSVPGFFGFGYAGACRSAMEVGGDFFDVVPLSPKSVLLVIADVMGKGVRASCFAGSLRTLIRALATPDCCPAACLDELNEIMFEELSREDMFITVQLVVADLHQRKLQVANAGHCPLLISSPDERTRAIAPEGIPLGIDRATRYCSETAAIPPLASLLLYTDGVTEARTPAGDLFGQGRLETWFGESITANLTAVELGRSLMGELVRFQGNEFAADDQTFLILTDETPRQSAPAWDPLKWFLHWTYPGVSAASLNRGR